ncbi:MAG: hypothetical protein GXN98_01665 [Euryarchaeota archaeon]|nr:hypothetical protein [Euryarchaeota archaeon]
MRALYSLAMVALLVFGTAAAYAQPPAAKKPENRYMLAKENYQKAMQMYRSAKQEYGGMRGMFGRPREDMLRNMLLRTIDAMLAHLELVRARAEVSVLSQEEKARIYERLDAHAEYLRQKRQEVQEAESRSELIDIAREVRAEWIKARMELKSAAGIIAVSRFNYVIEREEIGDRVEVRIDALKQAGYNTTELEQLLSEYRRHLSAAKNSTEAAEEKFSAISSPANAAVLFREGRHELREAQTHLTRMFSILRKIIKQLRQSEVVTGAGHLYASGNGSAVIQGTGGVYLRGRGELTVRVEKGRVRVDGWGKVRENQDGSVTYTGSGRAMVTGRGIYLRVEGEELVIRASGRGRAELSGTGVWRTSGINGTWGEEVSYGA